VVSYRVPVGEDSAHQFRKPLRAPADQEECGADTEGGEQVQVSWRQFGMWAVVER
jgi:hypothetical protein